ncbi:hypothetical protein [Mucilaginibacter polytrichastri]|uniref:hypothetical protein n=1 Tax=Mucilaginibacter polytrichastri TaxID=1302689 RepID=UPI0008F1DA7F|nr:hypothetical protein [Mucilaginibacter polytrichastri]SFS47757.1 hypothetical protein SAMN04487890_101724 [Mucilaginibacter polytrichastri]
MENFTHKAKIYGFTCYYNDKTGEIEGVSWFNRKMIDLFIWIDVNLTGNEMFRIEIIERL